MLRIGNVNADSVKTLDKRLVDLALNLPVSGDRYPRIDGDRNS